ncbi:MAG: response regulator [Bacteroidales bacterium]|nr:response regulator [Bacteroidales bacterium]
MATPFLLKADKWITRILYHPSLDKDSLAQKKINWISSVAVTSMIFCVTLAYHIIFPQLKLLIYYGLILTLIYLQGVIYPLFMKQLGVWRTFLDQSAVVIITFVFILLLGGIPYSGGLIFVGLAQVLFSLNFRERRATVWIFVIYIVTVILAGIFHPFLKVPPEMTMQVNISLYVINLLWISGFAMVFILNFISQRVMLEKSETDRIKEIDEARTRLFTNITHEFRTPLTVITGMNDLIRREPERWLTEGTDAVDRNAKVMLTLVNQMLDLSKLESGAMPVRLIRADINIYIRYIVELFRSVAATAKISLNYTPCEPSPVIDYDPEKLMQIVSNLISNALKFTQQTGSVEISTAMTEGREFEIRVSDNGSGISEDFLPNIFDRFSRGESGHSDITPGSGLGLALTKELVLLLGGTIKADSVYGSGTEFVVTLPATQTADVQTVPGLHEIKGKMSHVIFNLRSQKRKVPEISLHGHTERPMVLVVEDNDDVIHYLMNILSKDYDVIVAGSGDEGLNKAIEYIPDLILTDIMMPVMDGIEMLGRVKQNPLTSHIPVVVLTARADVASRIDGLGRGADAYLAKPFNSEELQVQLHSLISQRKRLQERYAAVGHLDLEEEKDFHIEDAFMKKVREIMLANLGDENLDIQHICDQMSMSRTQLYRKFRSLTNKTVTEYLRSLRLHRAHELLTGHKLTVAEAAYRTGFRNVSHFSRVYKFEFGINPSGTVR